LDVEEQRVQSRKPNERAEAEEDEWEFAESGPVDERAFLGGQYSNLHAEVGDEESG